MLAFKAEYYLYRHIRLDTNRVFYIGIGKSRCYSRAKSKLDRNKHWINITRKTDYAIEIIVDSLSKDEAEQKEKEFIGIYGRMDLGVGTLVNLTNGGYGKFGIIVNKQTRKKLSLAMIGNPSGRKGKKADPETCLKIGAAKLGNQYWLGRYHTAESKIKIGIASLGRCNNWEGKKHSQSSKNKIIESKLGRKMPASFSKKQSDRVAGGGNPMFGKRHSDETKRKISETKMRNKCLVYPQ